MNKLTPTLTGVLNYHQPCLKKARHTITAFFTEIYAMAYSAAIFHRGKRKQFHYYGLNPKQLTEEEAQKPAIISLNGLAHNQSGALKLAKKLQNAGIGPFFTASMRYNTKNPKVHHKYLQKRLKEIEALYKAHGLPARFILIGHSYGAKTAIELLPKGYKIEKIITLAGRVRADKTCSPELVKEIKKVEAIIKKNPSVPIYHIVAGKDYLLSLYSGAYYTDKKHCYVAKNRSHLGVTRHEKSLKKVLQFINAEE